MGENPRGGASGERVGRLPRPWRTLRLRGAHLCVSLKLC